jgi:hypothetical protein
LGGHGGAIFNLMIYLIAEMRNPQNMTVQAEAEAVLSGSVGWFLGHPLPWRLEASSYGT